MAPKEYLINNYRTNKFWPYTAEHCLHGRTVMHQYVCFCV